MKNMVTVTNGIKMSGNDKILFSDVVITRKRNLFWGRKWSNMDVWMVGGILSVHILACFAPFMFTWNAFLAGFCAYMLMTFGVSVSYHRNLSHHSLKLPKWLEYIFAYLGVLSFQRDPIFWVSIHRFHHQFVDTEKDAHSPIFGFWFSHIGWLFDSSYIIEKYKERNNVEDLKSQAFYRFLRRTYLYHILAFAALVYAFGGFTYLVWILGVGNTCTYHAIWLVNSAAHTWGYQSWHTNDLSKNNWWVALLSFGEGWHNNHHAFEYSARCGLEWWQIDFGWYVIKFLEALGLATNVKSPTESHKLKKSFASINKYK